MPRPPDLPNLFAWLCALWLVTAAALLGFVFWGSSVELHWTTDLYLGATLIMSLIAFLAMGLDKYKARRNQRRIPESVLHTFELIGGWPGSMLGQRMFHHKTSKIIYQATFGGIVLVHLLLLAWLLYVWWTEPEPIETPTPTETAIEAETESLGRPLAAIEGDRGRRGIGGS